MTDLVIVICAVVGTLLMVIASLGVLRLPDFFHRIHPPAKSSTLGLFLLLLAVAIDVPDTETITKAGLAFLFLALTAPVAIHLLARAAYRQGIPSVTTPDPDDYRAVVDRLEREEGSPPRPVEAEHD